MRANFFLIIFFVLIFHCTLWLRSRELSIKQLEERKKADLEREKKEKKEGKNFSKRNYNYNEIFLFSSKEEKLPCLSLI